VDDERLWPWLQTGVNLPIWKDKEVGPRIGGGALAFGAAGGFQLLQFDKVLYGGLNKLIEEAEEELRNTRITNVDSVSKRDWLKAVIIIHKAIIRYANRYAVLAGEMASKEADPTRKKELERMAATCQWVPANPARDFYEAMQSFWFMWLMEICPVNPVGRLDQFMYPIYKKSIAEGTTTDEEVLELLQHLRIKCMQLNTVYTREQQKKRAGMARWNNVVIGGLTRDGRDATNELSYLILEAAMRCQTPHYTISVRVHEGTPEALMKKSMELVKTGIGMPAFVGDKSYMEFLLSRGASIEDARDYCLVGCLDVGVTGKTRICGMTPFQNPLVFDIFWHNGVYPRNGKQWGPKTGEMESFETFDAFMKAWKKQLAYWIGLEAENKNVNIILTKEFGGNPYVTSLSVDDAIKVGKDFWDRPFPIENGHVNICGGMINVADSIAAVKKLVFDEKKVTMKELKAALAANWQGDRYQEIRKMCLAAPKYGNDDDYVDLIARDLYKFFADEVASNISVFGAKGIPSGISVSSHWPGGELTGASPEGRYAGEYLADGSMSPAQGRDTHGFTAVLRSAMKIDQVPYQATLLNVKMHPSALKTTEDMKKLSDLTRTYFAMGGKHIQFNVVGRETLLDAQKRPEKYRELVVRVAGYSAYFTQIAKPIQDEIIARTEMEKVA
jgi:formate C-acetyltransferase